ncbi:biopolymer transporter ExbD [Corallococcus exiguus]|uniref:ExbD/TolR family protein n=1 Tax=Corallococcus sp. AB032C TaxID=2316717 RepID=UPI000ECB8293|nr:MULTISPECIES: biopolymer transporter ExbD [Corallococcus]NNC03928.1 biopolymer transporter ExbD [Corallococcus exiguus]NPC47826.1 biopolymer transporter ExbD [Corallococcus exiguus]RKH82314.1 biopolymer transporter ExbD [Corallococcus sp. AB032C]
MGMAVGGRGGVKADINVTPLVDVVLVLLIIFMVVTPLSQQDKEVTLPTAAQGEPREKPEPLVFSLTADKMLYVGNESFPDAARFQERVQQELRARPDRKLLLKADETLTCGDVLGVLQQSRDAGALKVSLGVSMRKN